MTPLYCYSLRTWFIRTKTRFRESNSQKPIRKNLVSKIFTPGNTSYNSVVWWWWPLTGYREIPRCPTPRICLATSCLRKSRTCFSHIFLLFFFFCTLRACLSLLSSARPTRAYISSLGVRVPCSCVHIFLSVRRHLKSDVFVDDSCVIFRWCVKRKLYSEVSGKLTVSSP